jgi:transposase InsO family protein
MKMDDGFRRGMAARRPLVSRPAVVDQFTRECLLFPCRQLADRPKSRNGIVTSNRGRRAPASIMVETARSFAVAQWKPGPISISVQLDFIRPGCPAENGYIESFNGRLPMSA